MYDRVKKAIQKEPERVGYLINPLLISRHLERIANHATNISEEVISRHQKRNFGLRRLPLDCKTEVRSRVKFMKALANE